MKASDMRPGMAFMIDGQLCVCAQATHVTPGNLRAFVQAKLRRLADGVMLEKRLRSTEEVEQAFLDRRDMEYLYSDSTGHVLMDNKTYDQITVSDDVVGDAIKYFKPNTTITVSVHNGNVVSLELPNTVELQVTETEPGIKGATATKQLKEATLETGLKTRVPPFISVGEIVRISTADGSYLGRAKE
ncbi:MAG TPA: elongation factor P [Sedimentisphaerales bacterium]|nr:elongation factor P [Sedimentisphaerales bacterium]HRS11445.1 elongation factor P [Sedimentisphaerales bacterium]HRV48017.1 elongation factor P [Sedimentisphaerales bacterium]